MQGQIDFLSVDQVATQLGLHVRTVRNYVRSGRLKAVRIGKQYRIARENLDALTGHQGPPTTASREASGPKHVDVSTIVDIDAISFEDASRIGNALMASVKGRPESDDPVRIDTIYDKERARLKVILSGSIATTASLLKFIDAYLQS